MSQKLQRKHRHPLWRRLRIYFRRFRMTLWCVLLVLLCGGLYLNMVGLPGFIQRPLLESLRGRGLDLEFTRLRVSWHRGLVADNLRLRGMDNPTAPRFEARSADLRINANALLHRRLEVSGIELRTGQLSWELATNGEPSRVLALTNINAMLNFRPGDEWSLDRFEAGMQGARFNVTATITNGTALRDWPMFQPGPKQPREVTLQRLRRIQATLAACTFTGRPDFRLALSGDATAPRSFSAVLHIAAEGADTPWGEFQSGLLRVNLTASKASVPVAARLLLSADAAKTRWAELRDLRLDVESAETEQAEILACLAKMQAASVVTRWASAESVDAAVHWSHDVRDPMPRTGQVELQATKLNSRWAQGGSLTLRAHTRPAATPLTSEPALAYWNWLLPYDLDLAVVVTNAATAQLTLPRCAFEAHWQAPELQLTNVSVQFPEGQLTADSAVNILSREVQFGGDACFDFHRIGALLTPKSRAWIEQFQWSAPPRLQMEGKVRLPAWTNRQPDWRAEVKPTIELAGAVALTNGSYRGVTAERATTHLTYTNHLWRLPNLALTRPEGTLHVSLQSHELTRDYRIQLRGPIHPSALASQLDEKGRRGLGYIESATAPFLDGEVVGRWYERDRIGARASVTWTNFSYRQQHADRLEAALTYSNQVLEVFQPRVERGQERVTADYLKFDFAENRAWLTNGYTDTDPNAIAIVIGPKVAEAVKPYQFLRPPVARVKGIIPLRGERDADLHFDVEGGPFHWTLFKLPHIAGHVCWANEAVVLSNITAQFYGGTAQGEAFFDVSKRGSTPYRFALAVTNTDLHALMSDVHSPTNQLEGIFTGTLNVTDANTRDWGSWQGHGRAQLQNGLIWDSPVFGVMSKAMNTIIPGIGNSRAKEAFGSYTITNSVIHTSDLKIEASGMRLLYAGTVDFQKQVDARVEAELLRNAPLFGKAVSVVLWPVSKLFEYRVTGTLAAPKPEPLYLIPRIFLAPLTPMKSLKSIFTVDGPMLPEVEPAPEPATTPAQP